MILRVEFDQFPETVKRLLPSAHAYVSSQGAGAVATAADHKSGVVIVSAAGDALEEASRRLKEAGLEVFKGQWSLDDGALGGAACAAYVAAVAYVSEEAKPGLWLDAYPAEPTLAQVMRGMYDEFLANGEVGEEVSLEEFIRLANPNVVIVPPDHIAKYAEAKSE